MEGVVTAAITGFLAAIVGSLSVFLNRRNMAKVSTANATLTHAQATETLTGTALTLVQEMQEQLGQCREDVQQEVQGRLAAIHQFELAMAYLRMIQHVMTLEGIKVPPLPHDEHLEHQAHGHYRVEEN